MFDARSYSQTTLYTCICVYCTLRMTSTLHESARWLRVQSLAATVPSVLDSSTANVPNISYDSIIIPRFFRDLFWNTLSMLVLHELRFIVNISRTAFPLIRPHSRVPVKFVCELDCVYQNRKKRKTSEFQYICAYWYSICYNKSVLINYESS